LVALKRRSRRCSFGKACCAEGTIARLLSEKNFGTVWVASKPFDPAV
jgi:hypothetical protein